MPEIGARPEQIPEVPVDAARIRLVFVGDQYGIDNAAYSVGNDDLGPDIIADPPFPHNYRICSVRDEHLHPETRLRGPCPAHSSGLSQQGHRP